MEEMMDEMVKKYPVDGEPTSLKDLGYLYVGLDDHVSSRPFRHSWLIIWKHSGKTARQSAPTAPSCLHGSLSAQSPTAATTTTNAAVVLMANARRMQRACLGFLTAQMD